MSWLRKADIITNSILLWLFQPGLIFLWYFAETEYHDSLNHFDFPAKTGIERTAEELYAFKIEHYAPLISLLLAVLIAWTLCFIRLRGEVNLLLDIVYGLIGILSAGVLSIFIAEVILRGGIP